MTTTFMPIPTLAWEPGAPEDRELLSTPEAAAEIACTMIGSLDREACVLLALDTQHRIIRAELISMGTVTNTFMAPREILRAALLAGATAIIVAHNHPSGSPEPSTDDERVTRRLASAGEIVGIELLDHLVVSGERWVSLARKGMV